MTLEDLGYSKEFESYRQEQNLESFEVGRVISEHKERYVVKTTQGEYAAEILGNLRFMAQKRSDFPAVGDWVAISEYEENKVLIHSVFKRKTIIERQTVRKQSEKQIIATNVDYALIVQAIDRDFNINRIERYLTICNTSGVEPIIILSKIDLLETIEIERIVAKVKERIKNVVVLIISNESNEGLDRLKEIIIKSKTYCLLGSSGVGKSTLLNNLSGLDYMKTGTINNSSNRGKHVTTHRELFILEKGGILIDNPGMREVGIADSTDGLDITFESIIELSYKCKFKDCTHTTEIGCALIDALENGELDKSSFENYLKMKREKEFFELNLAEKRKRDKEFGKMIKQHKKGRKSNQF